MENEEKNIKDDIEESQSKQMASMFDENSEIINENQQAFIEEQVAGEQSIEETNEIIEPTEVEKASQEGDKTDFSFLDALDNVQELNIEKQNEEQDKKQESLEFKDIVSVVDDFEQDNETKGLITVRPVKFQEFEQTEPKRTIKRNLDIMQDVSMHISVELGRTKSSIREVMEMEVGKVVELDKIAGEQVEVFVNDKLVAKGEVIVIEDKFGVRITSTNIQKQI
ncbi:MAG: flagellar motor switch protein FliN [Candidatus Gastranaerophilales bacterium]|nr:flagellar motor switch protein FliN [Candidatus Gastranaerophilales bacterium]